jgi:DNA adenine methylase
MGVSKIRNYRKLFPYSGGQSHLLPTLLPLIPEHKLYLEPFCGSATVLWNKMRSTQEVVNDKDDQLINMLRVVKENPDELKPRLGMPSSEDLFYKYQKEIKTETDPVRKAGMYLYRINSSWSGTSKRDSSFVPKTRNSSASKIDQLDWFSKRLKDVCIENLDCVEAIKKYDAADTFVLADPSYRIVGKNLYEYSFTDSDHIRLAKAFKEMKGKFLITYNNDKFIQLIYKNYPQIVVKTAKTMDKAHTNTTEEHRLIANFDIIHRKFPHFTGTYFKP